MKATKELVNVVNVKDKADEFDRLLERLNLIRASATKPVPGQLPEERLEEPLMSSALILLVRPIRYKRKGNKEGFGYLRV